MRALGLALMTCCHMFSPLPALLLHACYTLLTWNPGYCSTALLAAPLAQLRQAELARALELASLPLAAVQPIAGQLAVTFEGEAYCRWEGGGRALWPAAGQSRCTAASR